LAGLLIALWLYYRNKKNPEVPGWVLKFLFTLRFFSVSLVSLLLLNILLRQVVNETENPVILLAIDNSTSMVSGRDSTFIKNNFLANLNKLKGAIGEKFTVKTILFGESAITTADKPDFDKKQTDIENLIKTIDNNYSNLNVGALIIATDGIYNKGGNPVYEAQKLNFPVFSIALGETSEVRDVLIQKVNHNKVAFLGNNFPVEIIIKAKKYAGKKIAITVSSGGQQVQRAESEIKNDNFLSTANFTLSADKAGVSKYEARVSVLEGETNVSNNSFPFVIEVLDNKEKILLLANAPHPDINAIREALTLGTSYDTEYRLAEENKEPLQKYSLIIIHGFSPDNKSILNECIKNNIPFWLVNPITAENLPGLRIAGSMGRYNDAEPASAKTFGLFTISDPLKKFLNDFPAVKSFFGNYTLSNNSESLINQRLGSIETENPLFYFNHSNELKSAVFIGDGLWKWKFRDFSEHRNHNLFNELIIKSAQYLSVKSDKSFFRVQAPRIVNENDQVELNAEVYNKSYEAITEPDVTLLLTNNEGKKFNYTFSKGNKSYKLNLGILQAGEYNYVATTRFNNENYTRNGVITVKEIVAEKLNTVANHDVLYQISGRTGGKVFASGDLDSLEKEILSSERIKPITYSQNMTLPLVELKWIFWTILLFLGIEWFFRKRYFAI
jgi:hypothetical protein